MKKVISTFIILLILFPAIYAQTAPAFWSDIRNFKRMDSIQLPSPDQILFVGSSTITRWKNINDYFPGYTIINRGFGGSTLKDIIRYTYDIILPYNPKQIVIYCGENDIGWVMMRKQ